MEFFWIVSVVFVHKELGAHKENKIKVGLQYTNKKLSLPGDVIVYATEDLAMNWEHSAFSK